MWMWSPRCVWWYFLATQSFRVWCACRSPHHASLIILNFLTINNFIKFKISNLFTFAKKSSRLIKILHVFCSTGKCQTEPESGRWARCCTTRCSRSLTQHTLSLLLSVMLSLSHFAQLASCATLASAVSPRCCCCLRATSRHTAQISTNWPRNMVDGPLWSAA